MDDRLSINFWSPYTGYMHRRIFDTAEKIQTMEIRGAGRIAVAAASAIRDYAAELQADSMEEFSRKIQEAADVLINTRPTAVSLPNAVRIASSHSSGSVEESRAEIIENAENFIKQAQEALGRIGEIGARRIRDSDVVLTHCNSHAALAAIKKAFDQGKNISVIATESRPRKQGLLTIKELNDYGIPATLIVDSAVRSVIKDVDIVIVGADAIAVNGTLVNKIGTSQIALMAHEARVNFLVAAETYKFSPDTILGQLIDIEERSKDEVIDPGVLKDMENVTVKNPAFDFTPAEYIDLIITEIGAIPPGMAYTIIKEHLGWKLADLR
ncbi:translation initiation factor, aIF-2BII family [Methanosalsum zhilinae DSM 4017]|uniref:Ribose 1,5-bisphosphate isomerase n=2 Tax=Methanosalsum zhilinae TaxID=39669 RepID=F7XMF2_METZD|nr:translation initiation factor, aIF-2BII family [Methanosalsum zhilinae DSM 4017]